MKPVSYIVAALALMVSMNAFASEKYTRSMLKQVSDVNSSWKPIIGQNMYVVRRESKHDTIYLMLFYNSYRFTSGSMVEPDPEVADTIVVFQAKDNKCVLRFIDQFAGIELVKKNLDLLVP